MSYNTDGSLATEGNVGYTYDALGRRINMSVTSGPVTNYTYDAMSRLATVSDGTRTATYNRVSGSSLLASTTINNGTADVLTATRTYDTLDRLTNITSNGISYTYTYDNSDKRTKNVLSDGSYWIYEYDDLGQVTKGKKYTASGIEVVGQSFGYDYDDIGNLKTENRNGNVFKYTANSVNQYTERTVPSRINISGSADASAKVTIKQTSAGYTRPTRYGNYFNAFFNLDNTSNSVSDSFDIYAVKYDGTKDIVAHQTVNLFIPKTPEQFTYDNDGNLLTDGRFVYSWNGENRLVSAVETSKQKIEYAYDYSGRRYERKSYSWNGSDWTLASTIKYVYDGNNVIAEYDAANNLLKSYLWGEDVSGSLQGAGGVGGLLLVNDTVGVYLPYYDGNGNIMGYIDSSDGTSKASYEYNPFGKIICKYGSKSDDFNYQFSTKYYDTDNGLLWYRYRAYIPEIARWSTRDPIGEQGGENLYRYTKNDGVNQYDYLGKYTIGIGIGGSFEIFVPITAIPSYGLQVSVSEQLVAGYDRKKWICRWCDTGSVTVLLGVGASLQVGLSTVFTFSPTQQGDGYLLSGGIQAGSNIPEIPLMVSGSIDVAENGDVTITIPRVGVGVGVLLSARVSASCTGCTEGILSLPKYRDRIKKIVECLEDIDAAITKAVRNVFLSKSQMQSGAPYIRTYKNPNGFSKDKMP